MNTRGFTLIELVIVIVLLGILSAVALPRFLDLSTDAKRSVNQGIAGAMASSISTFYGAIQLPGKVFATAKNAGGTLTLKAIDPGNGNYYLFLGTNNYPMGGSLKSGSTPAGANNTAIAPWTSNLADPAGYEQGCVNLFNALVSDSSVQAGLANWGASDAMSASAANPTAAYLAIKSGALDTAAPALPTGASATLGSTDAAAGSCLWVKTDSLNSAPVFFIYYDKTSGGVAAMEK